MLHRGMDWLWVVVEGEENSDYAQIKRANRRVTYRTKGRVTCYVEEFVYIASRIANIILTFNVFSHVVLVSQLLCWTGQFLGHGMFEKRAPALLDNLVQAFLMAPFFVLLEVLRSLFGYEPYPGFHMLVNAKIKAEIKEWQDKKQKKVS
ncbi:hypothetical protein V6Z11_A11G035700 [Gossypium hirsutum]